MNLKITENLENKYNTQPQNVNLNKKLCKKNEDNLVVTKFHLNI